MILDDVRKRLYKIAESMCLVTAQRLTLRDLNPPPVVLANTYYWAPGRSSEDRRQNEHRWQKRVAEWLLDLDEKFELGLEVIWDPNANEVKAFKGEELVAYFKYRESASNVYKHQDFRDLLALISEKARAARLPELSEREERFFKWWAEAMGVPSEGRLFTLLVERWRPVLRELVEWIEFRSSDEVKGFRRAWSDRLKGRISEVLDVLRSLGIRNYGSEVRWVLVLLGMGLAADEVKNLVKIFGEMDFTTEEIREIVKKAIMPQEMKAGPLRDKFLGEIVKSGPRNFYAFLELLTKVLSFSESDMEFLMDVWGVDEKTVVSVFEKATKRDLYWLREAVRKRSEEATLRVLERMVGRRLEA